MSLRGYSYTAEIEKAAKNSRWNDCLTDVPPEKPQISQQAPLQMNYFHLKHSFASLLELGDSLYYFFICEKGKEEKRAEFNLAITAFQKQYGNNRSIVFKDFKGTPSTITTALMTLNPSIHEVKEEDFGKYQAVALIGLQQGFIKVVELVENGRSMKPVIFSHKIEQKPVVSIVAAEKRHYGRNICFILVQDSKVFVYNFLSKLVLAVFQPPVLSHDFAICLALHMSATCLATASKSGQIFFWELGKSVMDAVERSENRIKKKSKKADSLEEVQEMAWELSPKDRVINVFPMYALHSASIHGLKWISFYGDLLATVSRTGLFRLIAVNFQMRDQFLNLIQYQIENGEAISSVQIFPQLEVLVVTKCKQYSKLITEEDLRNNDDSKKSREEGTKGMDYNSNCYGVGHCADSLIEKVKFGSDLRVERVERMHVIDIKKREVDLRYSIVSEQCNFLLVGNNQTYYVAPCEHFFGVDR